MRKMLTANELVEIYRMRQKGMKLREIAQIVGGGVTTGGLSGALKELRVMMSGNHSFKYRNKTYREAVYILKGLVKDEPVVEIIFPDIPALATDRYQVMQNAFDSFQSAVTEYIKLEVESQVGEIKLENESLKKASADLQSVVTAARQSNWADTLRASFGGR